MGESRAACGTTVVNRAMGSPIGNGMNRYDLGESESVRRLLVYRGKPMN